MLKNLIRLFSKKAKKIRKKIKFDSDINKKSPNYEIINSLYYNNKDNNYYSNENDNNISNKESENIQKQHIINNKEELILKLKSVTNNTNITKTILKYLNYVDTEVYKIYFDKLEDNFRNLNYYKQRSIDDFNIKRNRLLKKNKDANINYNLIFLDKKDFISSEEFKYLLTKISEYISIDNSNLDIIDDRLLLVNTLYAFDKNILFVNDFIIIINNLLQLYTDNIILNNQSFNYNNFFIIYENMYNKISIKPMLQLISYLDNENNLLSLNEFSLISLYFSIIANKVVFKLIDNLEALILSNLNAYDNSLKLKFIINSIKYDNINTSYFSIIIYSIIKDFEEVEYNNLFEIFFESYDLFKVKYNNNTNYLQISKDLDILGKYLESKIFEKNNLKLFFSKENNLLNYVEYLRYTKDIDFNKVDLISSYLCNSYIKNINNNTVITLYNFIISHNFCSNPLCYLFEKVITHYINNFLSNLDLKEIENKTNIIENNIINDTNYDNIITTTNLYLSPFNNILELFYNYLYTIKTTKENKKDINIEMYYNKKTMFENIDKLNIIITKIYNKLINLKIGNNSISNYNITIINKLLKGLSLDGLGTKKINNLFEYYNIEFKDFSAYLENENTRKYLNSESEITFNNILKLIDSKDLQKYKILYPNYYFINNNKIILKHKYLYLKELFERNTDNYLLDYKDLYINPKKIYKNIDEELKNKIENNAIITFDKKQLKKNKDNFNLTEYLRSKSNYNDKEIVVKNDTLFTPKEDDIYYDSDSDDYN